jgi:hypothetical protein
MRARGEEAHAMSKVNPIQVQRLLSGVDYPADKRDLVRAATDQGADEETRDTLQQLPDREFDSPADVSSAIGQIE